MKSIRFITVLLLSILLVLLTAGCATGSGQSSNTVVIDDDDDEEMEVWDNPDTISDVPPGVDAVGGEDTAQINFEGEFGDFMYNPGDAVTEVDTGATVTPATDFVYAGSQSARIDGSIQKYKYSSSKFVSYRINAAEMLGKKNLEIVGKMIKVRIFVPSEFSNTAIQFLVLDFGFSWAESVPIQVEAGKWNTLYFKLLSSSAEDNTKYKGRQCSLASYTPEGKKKFVGQYTGNGFNSYTINAFEIRSLNGTLGDNATVFVDSIEWEE